MTKKEFVSMSLPYALKVLIPESDTKGCRKTVIGTVGAVYDDGSITCHDTVNACPKWYKPILKPIDDLVNNEIDWKDFYQMMYLIKNITIFPDLLKKVKR